MNSEKQKKEWEKNSREYLRLNFFLGLFGHRQIPTMWRMKRKRGKLFSKSDTPRGTFQHACLSIIATSISVDNKLTSFRDEFETVQTKIFATSAFKRQEKAFLSLKFLIFSFHLFTCQLTEKHKGKEYISQACQKDPKNPFTRAN